MRKSKIFSLLLVIFFVGCARHNENMVIIHSNPADNIFTEINLVAPGTEQKITFEGGKTFRYEIDTVEARDFYGKCSDGYFWTSMFITPGDSVSFKTIAKDENSYDVIFEGKHAAHYNYVSQKEKSISQEEPNFFSNPNIDLLEYKQQLQDYRDKENKFLRNYRKKYAVSEDFVNYALAEINNLYALSSCLFQ